jgi:hypothetical protein
MAVPVAVCGAEIEVPFAQLPKLVQLDGTSSTADSPRTITAYAWTLVQVPEGSTAELSDPAVSQPTLTADKPGTYLFSLQVTDSAAEMSDTNIRTMPSSAFQHVTCPTEFMGFEVPAQTQRSVSRQLQQAWHATEAKLKDYETRIAALEP